MAYFLTPSRSLVSVPCMQNHDLLETVRCAMSTATPSPAMPCLSDAPLVPVHLAHWCNRAPKARSNWYCNPEGLKRASGTSLYR